MTDPEAGSPPSDSASPPGAASAASPAPAGPAPVEAARSLDALLKASPAHPGALKNGKPEPARVALVTAGETDAALPTIKAGTEDYFVEARGSFVEKDVAGYVPSPESDHLRVRTTSFEGPFDLLLHLIEKHALQIFDIPIKLIVKEYLAVLDDMRDLNLDVAGEFLVMAAQLAHIKSKMLLPKEERKNDEEDEVDPRADLVRRLLEYQRFKDAAQRMDGLLMLGRDLFGRPNTVVQYDGPIEAPPEDIYTALNLAETDVFDLIRLFDQMLKKQQKLVVHEVLVERISVGARINEVVDIFLEGIITELSFANLVDRFGPRTKRGVIVTFLAVLEMTRLKLIRIVQDEAGAISLVPVLENLRSDDENTSDSRLQQTLAQVDEFEPGAETGIESAEPTDDAPAKETAQ